MILFYIVLYPIYPHCGEAFPLGFEVEGLCGAPPGSYFGVPTIEVAGDSTRAGEVFLNHPSHWTKMCWKPCGKKLVIPHFKKAPYHGETWGIHINCGQNWAWYLSGWIIVISLWRHWNDGLYMGIITKRPYDNSCFSGWWIIIQPEIDVNAKNCQFQGQLILQPPTDGRVYVHLGDGKWWITWDGIVQQRMICPNLWQFDGKMRSRIILGRQTVQSSAFDSWYVFTTKNWGFQEHRAGESTKTQVEPQQRCQWFGQFGATRDQHWPTCLPVFKISNNCRSQGTQNINHAMLIPLDPDW